MSKHLHKVATLFKSFSFANGYQRSNLFEIIRCCSPTGQLARAGRDVVETMPLRLRFMEIPNLGGRLICCECEWAVTLESAALIVRWIYSCLISTTIIHSWQLQCLPRGQIARGNISECDMGALSTNVIIRSQVIAAPLSYLHSYSTRVGMASKGQFYLFSQQIPSHLSSLSMLLTVTCSAFSLFLYVSAPALVIPWPTSGYLHLCLAFLRK